MSEAATLPATFADFKPPAPKQAIQKIRYSHDAMIDMIVANPWISQGDLATNFGYTEGWVSQVIASDAFQARLAERKNELIDPHLRATVEERFKGLVIRSVEILMRKLDAGHTKVSDELALKALEISAKAAGFGAKSATVAVQQNFVVQVPAKSASTEDWQKEHSAGGKTVSTPPAFKTLQSVQDAVLVDSGSAALPDAKSLLAELKGG